MTHIERFGFASGAPTPVQARAGFDRFERSLGQFARPLTMRWRSLSLSYQFLVVSSVVLVSSMAILGAWVSHQLETRVVQNTAVSTAFFFDSLIEPTLQPLARQERLSPEAIDELDRILRQTALGRTIANIKIWATDGTIIYSTNKEQIGKSYPETAGFKGAADNRVIAEFDDLDEAENEQERLLNRPLLEVYSPIHQHGTSKVIAVAELYQFGDGLRAELVQTRLDTFLVVGTTTIAMLALLYTIVRKGSSTIAAQETELRNKIDVLGTLLRQNEELNERVVSARKMLMATNERLLHRIGGDLHDGPAQLIGLALLYYDGLAPGPAPGPNSTESFEKVRGLLQDALADLRNISADIAPPELDTLNLKQTIEVAIRNHQRRTGTALKVDIGTLPDQVAGSLKTCVYRFVQEGLNNAFRHAPGSETSVAAQVEGTKLKIEVADRGPGFDPAKPRKSSSLGLAGLTDRIEACEGKLKIKSSLGNGTKLACTFELLDGDGA